VPYRIDLAGAAADAFDRLIDLGALDAEPAGASGIAALMPDDVTPAQIAGALGVAADDIVVSHAAARDAGSTWILGPRPIAAGRLRILPAHFAAEPQSLRLVDAAAFGTGLHPTTALCLDALDEEVSAALPDAVLDVGTGSGVLALAALTLGVPRATGIDIDADALRTAAENARLNGLGERLELRRGGPEAVTGTWPLVLANVLPAPLIEMAPTLVRRVGHHGLLVLSGISSSLEHDVAGTYRRLGMRRLRTTTRAGWVALVLQASW
jgi:ribosomal protein L11 methyltransferase